MILKILLSIKLKNLTSFRKHTISGNIEKRIRDEKMKNILSENINISFNSRETGINNNVFFCGSSNNRTSFLESNIFQMNCIS